MEQKNKTKMALPIDMYSGLKALNYSIENKLSNSNVSILSESDLTIGTFWPDGQA